MKNQILKKGGYPSSINNSIEVNGLEKRQFDTNGDCSSKLYPGEFPYCGNCIHYSGPRVCPVSNVSIDSTSDGTDCVLSGVYRKKHVGQEAAT